MLFFCCLFKLQVVRVADLPDLVLLGFSAYMGTMRALQSTYLLEPAGSHGVWGLDDHHCLLFLLGAHQLDTGSCGDSGGENIILPADVLDKRKLEKFHEQYLYLSGIR